jgi:hypothetical protein
VQTKSGTNQVTGDVYIYHQDNQLNARTFFAAPDSPKAVRQRSQYGFTTGGPVVRNKLFAFGNVDRTKLDGENNLTRDLLLPAALAAADARQRHRRRIAPGFNPSSIGFRHR